MRRVVFLCLLPFFAGCAFSKDISHQKPYSDMVGQCYETVVEMSVYDNVCWESGGELIISPVFSKSCFRTVRAPLLAKGSRLVIEKIYRQSYGWDAPCFNITVTTPSLVAKEKPLYIPVCWSMEHLSWLKNKYTNMGEKIELSEAFVVHCKD